MKNREEEIREIIEVWGQAIRAKDPRGLVSHFAKDAVVFDLIEPLRYRGREAVEKRAEEWLSSFDGPVGYETRELTISAGEDTAFCHSLNHVNGTNKQGTQIDMWWRATVCFRRGNGSWLVTHEHSSVPFDMVSGKASLGLKP